MKNYTITVNGNVYDVTVEENGAGQLQKQHRRLRKQHRKQRRLQRLRQKQQEQVLWK